MELLVDLVRKFSNQEDNYQTLLRLHRQMGRAKGRMTKTQIRNLKSDVTSPVKEETSFQFADRFQENTGENPKPHDLEVAEEGKEIKTITGAVFSRSAMVNSSKSLKILHKKETTSGNSFKSSSQSQPESDERPLDLDEGTVNPMSPKPANYDDRTSNQIPSLTNLDDDGGLDKKKNLIQQIVDSMKKIGSDRSRYETLNSTLKSVSGWKAYVYSYLPCLMKKSTVASIVEIAEHDLYKKFDFVQLLHFMEEFKKLKRMLLTPDQQILFELVPGDKLGFTESEGKGKFTYHNHLDMMKGKEPSIDNTTRDDILAAFDRIWNQPNHSELDSNLLVSLGFFYYGDRKRNTFATRFGYRPSILG